MQAFSEMVPRWQESRQGPGSPFPGGAWAAPRSRRQCALRPEGGPSPQRAAPPRDRGRGLKKAFLSHHQPLIEHLHRLRAETWPQAGPVAASSATTRSLQVAVPHLTPTLDGTPKSWQVVSPQQAQAAGHKSDAEKRRAVHEDFSSPSRRVRITSSPPLATRSPVCDLPSLVGPEALPNPGGSRRPDCPAVRGQTVNPTGDCLETLT